MTKEEVLKHGLSSEIGLCELCVFRNSCEDIEIGFNKPKDCNGPYERYADKYYL